MPRGDSPARRIRECALELFSRHGVSGTSLQMIATELGVTKAAIYYHYRAKEDIVRAVLAPAFNAFDDLLARVSQHPVEIQPGMLVDGLARQAVTNRRLYATVLADITARELGDVSPERQATFAQLRATLAGRNPSPRQWVRASMFLTGLIGPAVDPDVLRLEDTELEIAIASAGRQLLGLNS